MYISKDQHFTPAIFTIPNVHPVPTVESGALDVLLNSGATFAMNTEHSQKRIAVILGNLFCLFSTQTFHMLIS